jgi:hypothetical protein
MPESFFLPWSDFLKAKPHPLCFRSPAPPLHSQPAQNCESPVHRLWAGVKGAFSE